MSLRRLTESFPTRRAAGATDVAAFARFVAAAGAALVLAACGSAPTAPDGAGPASDVPEEAKTRPLGPDAATGSPGAAASTAAADSGAAGTAVRAQPEIPKRALSDYERALGLMRSGNTGDAELEFKQLALGYPQLVGAQINLALLQRKANRLEEAETTLKSAVDSSPASASAWNELGLTQRMRGRFQDAAASYERALAADGNFAPAHRNYAVLLDLYLGDPERALTELERYKELTGEEKPITGWIAELRQRTGKPAAPRPAAAPAEPAPAESGGEQPASSDGAPAEEPAKPAAEPPQPRAGATSARAVIGTQESWGKGA